MKAQLALFQTPVLKAGAFVPRPYQSRANEAIDREHLINRATLVVHPTGSGKTVLFCLQALKHGSALILVHRDSLMQQARDKLSAAAGREVAIEKGAIRAEENPYVVASIQSLHPSRLKDFKRRFPLFPLIIIDEAHRATAKTYRNVLDAYPESKVLGVTATPDRSDKVGLKAVFGSSVADEYSILDATADGWLTPLRFHPVSSKVDLSGVKVVGTGPDRDFDRAELDSAIVQEAGKIAESVFKAVAASQWPDGRLIVFTPGVKTAHAGAAAMNAMREGCALVVDGEMDGRFQRAILERHRKGEAQYVFNCGVLLEGYDDPTLLGVFDAAPTKSRLRAMQKWGRATRLWPEGIHTLPTAAQRVAAIAASPKPWAIVFDLVLNSSEHDVIGPVDILGGKDLPPAIAKRARDIMKEKGGATKDAIAQAEEEEATKKRRAMAAKRLAAATAVTMGKPRSVFDRIGVEFIRRASIPGRPDERITKSMWGLLKHRGIPIPPNCTSVMFKRLLTMDKKREAKGLVRLGGVEFLRQHGIDGWKLGREQGIRVRDAIRANGGKKLTKEQLGEAMEREVGEEG